MRERSIAWQIRVPFSGRADNVLFGALTCLFLGLGSAATDSVGSKDLAQRWAADASEAVWHPGAALEQTEYESEAFSWSSQRPRSDLSRRRRPVDVILADNAEVYLDEAPIPNLKSLEEISDKDPVPKLVPEPVPRSKEVLLDEAPVAPVLASGLGAHVRLWRHLQQSWVLLQTHVGLISRRGAPDPAILILGLLSTIIALTAVMAFCSAAPVPRPKAEEAKRPVTRFPAPTAEQLASAGRRQARAGPDQGAPRGAPPGARPAAEEQYPPHGSAHPYSSVSVRAASAASLPPPKRPSHVGGEAGAMFSWSPRASDEEDTLCPCLVVPEGMEFVFAVREVLSEERQELSFSVVDLEGSALSHIIVNESGFGPQCGIFLQMLDREPLASVRTDMLYERPRRLPDICLPSGEVFGSLDREGRDYVVRDQRQQKLLRLQGNFREKAVKVISASGQLVALSERCIITFDSGSHYQVRVAPETDAGLVLCSLLAVDKIEGGRLR